MQVAEVGVDIVFRCFGNIRLRQRLRFKLRHSPRDSNRSSELVGIFLLCHQVSPSLQ